MTENTRTIVATAALPYANGPIHLGHILEYTQADIWTRFQKMRGHDCLYICADDTHGTPIMIEARKRGISPEALIEEFSVLHQKDFRDFEIEFDHFGSTHSEENREISANVYKTMVDEGHIHKKVIEQAYCEKDGMFLPDRFVKGTCPKCKSQDQYGDACNNCSATYDPKEMIDPRCHLCGNPPVLKDSEHFFFRLNDFREFLLDWVPKHTQSEVKNKLSEWFDEDLRDWDISRDKPYFGFEIPGETGKYFYVWLDAPIGYISSTLVHCKESGKNFDSYWRSKKGEVYHFIGKDIIRFHILFWPAMLKLAGFNTPNQVQVHGFITVNGEKMSKSKGTFITARSYLNHLEPAYLRYYYAAKLNSSINDIDLSFDDFVGRVNSDLIGKITNVASRGFQMLQKKLDGRLARFNDLSVDGIDLIKEAQESADKIAKHYEDRNFSKAILEIRAIADSANKYFDEIKPWNLIKTDPEQTRQVLTVIINVFRIMAIYLKPVLPTYVAKVEALFLEKPYAFKDAQKVIEDKTLATFSHLIQRIEKKKIEDIVSESKAQTEGGSPSQSAIATITIDDFAKVNLIVAKVVKASDVPGADKLLQLTLDIGGSERTVFSGIKSSYQADELTGLSVVLVENLLPRRMKFGVSEGMILASGDGDDVRLVLPGEGSKPGDKIS